MWAQTIEILRVKYEDFSRFAGEHPGDRCGMLNGRKVKDALIVGAHDVRDSFNRQVEPSQVLTKERIERWFNTTI